MPYASKFTEETKQHVISDYLAGDNVEAILKRHVMSVSGFRHLLKSRNVPKRPPGSPRIIRHVTYAKQHVASTPPPPQRKIKAPEPTQEQKVWAWEQKMIDEYGYQGTAGVAEKSVEVLMQQHPTTTYVFVPDTET